MKNIHEWVEWMDFDLLFNMKKYDSSYEDY